MEAPGGTHLMGRPPRSGGSDSLDSLINSVLECLMRHEAPPLRSLELAGEQDPGHAARALLQAASLRELAASRASWVPALMVSARPGLGATRLYQLARAYTKATGEKLDPARMPALAPILGSSERMGQLLVDNPEWADDLVGDPPAAPDLSSSAANFDAVREAQSRGMLSIVARELVGCPLETTFAELTGLAEACLATALQCASVETGVVAPAMFALGQFGGCELGLSPAIDLLFIDPAPLTLAEPDVALDGSGVVAGRVPGGKHGGKQGGERRSEIETLLAVLQRELDAARSREASYRWSGSQRPRGVVEFSVDSALEYFGHCASPYERRLFERIRPLQPDSALAQALLSGLAKRVDPARVRSVVDDELAYRAERADTQHSDHLIQGVGGVSDLEAIVRVHSAAAGSEKPSTQMGRTLLDTLHQLAASGAMDSAASARLADAYAWLRRAEHSTQLVDSGSSRCFPGDPQGQIMLARCMGYREPEANRARERLLEDRQEIRQQVQDQFEKCLLEPAG